MLNPYSLILIIPGEILSFLAFWNSKIRFWLRSWPILSLNMSTTYWYLLSIPIPYWYILSMLTPRCYPLSMLNPHLIKLTITGEILSILAIRNWIRLLDNKLTYSFSEHVHNLLVHTKHTPTLQVHTQSYDPWHLGRHSQTYPVKKIQCQAHLEPWSWFFKMLVP